MIQVVEDLYNYSNSIGSRVPHDNIGKYYNFFYKRELSRLNRVLVLKILMLRTNKYNGYLEILIERPKRPQDKIDRVKRNIESIYRYTEFSKVKHDTHYKVSFFKYRTTRKLEFRYDNAGSNKTSLTVVIHNPKWPFTPYL